MPNINIVYCFDKNYQQHFGASVTSLLMNYKGRHEDISIYIITENTDKSFTEKIDFLRNKFSVNFSLFSLGPDEIYFIDKLSIDSSHISYISKASWYRIFIPKLLPIDLDKVIYLDSDTIILGNITELMELELNENLIAGVKDYSSYKLIKHFNIPSYINSGVIIFNLIEWRKNNTYNTFLGNVIKNQSKYLFLDQCALNFNCQGKILLIPEKWNQFITKNTVSPSILYNGILHFITAEKPWFPWYENPLSEFYWRYLNLSPWANVPPYKVQNVIQAVRMARLNYRKGLFEKSISIYENIIMALTKK